VLTEAAWRRGGRKCGGEIVRERSMQADESDCNLEVKGGEPQVDAEVGDCRDGDRSRGCSRGIG
jgi:hypothetical protein